MTLGFPKWHSFSLGMNGDANDGRAKKRKTVLSKSLEGNLDPKRKKKLGRLIDEL